MALILALSYLPHCILYGDITAGWCGRSERLIRGSGTERVEADQATIGSRPSLAAGARPAGARPQRERKEIRRQEIQGPRPGASRKVEILHPEETVTLSGEREAADIEDVFTVPGQSAGRPGAGEEEGRGDRLAAAGGPGPAPVRPRTPPGPTCTCALPAIPAPGRPRWRCRWPTCCSGSATWKRATWSTPCVTTWSGNSSGIPHRKRGAPWNGPWAGSFLSTRRITCTGPVIQRITVRNASISCSR